MTAKRAFREIREYCEGLGNSSWTQAEYRMDFFRIFYNAYIHSRTGERATALYRNAKKRNKSVRSDDYVVHGDSIYWYLKRNWRGFSKDDRKQKIASDLGREWNAWTFAWDNSPNPVPGARYRKPEDPRVVRIDREHGVEKIRVRDLVR